MPATSAWAWLSLGYLSVPSCLQENTTNKHRPKTATRKVTIIPTTRYLAAAAPSFYPKDAAILLSIDNIDLRPDAPAPATEHIPKKPTARPRSRSEEHTSELQSCRDLVCRLLLEKKKKK